jgi:hypothetical protein
MDHSFGPYLEIARIQSEMNKLFDVLLVTRRRAGFRPTPGFPTWMSARRPRG